MALYAGSNVFTTTGTLTAAGGSGYEAGEDGTILITTTAGSAVTVTADFTGTPTSGSAPLTVTFTNLSSSSDEIDGYQWSFGDEATSTLTNPVHVYTQTGSFTVILTATAGTESDSEVKTDYITVEELIAGLVATNDSPTTLGQATTLTATVTAGSNVAYAWAFGDDTTEAGAVVTHTYPDAGVYTALVTASNSVSVLTATTPVTVSAAGPALVTRTITYSYDHLYRLTDADYSSGERFQYAYDAVGNRTAYTATITQTTVTTYSFDAANRLTKRVVDGSNTYLYTWSDAGRLTRETWNGSTVRTFAYDDAGRLTKATLLGITTTFRYNGDGHRLGKAVNGDPFTYTLDYARNAYLLVERSITSTRYYLHGERCIGEQNDETQAWSYYLADGARRVRQVVDETGEIDFAWSYSVSGEVLSGLKERYVLLDCPDGVYDWSTGLIFLGGRYFDPTLGIWIALGPLMVIQSWQGRKKKRRGKVWYALVLLVVCVGGLLAACDVGYEVVDEHLNGNVVFMDPCDNRVDKKWLSSEIERVKQMMTEALVNKLGGLQGFGSLGAALAELGVTPDNPIEFVRETGNAYAGVIKPRFWVYDPFFIDPRLQDDTHRASLLGHELAHYWDHDGRLSREMQEWVNWGEPASPRGRDGDSEDFAEALRFYFWPEYANAEGWTAERWTDDIAVGGTFDEYNWINGPDQLRMHEDQLALPVRDREPSPDGTIQVQDRYDFLQWKFTEVWRE